MFVALSQVCAFSPTRKSWSFPLGHGYGTQYILHYEYSCYGYACLVCTLHIAVSKKVTQVVHPYVTVHGYSLVNRRRKQDLSFDKSCQPYTMFTRQDLYIVI